VARRIGNIAATFSGALGLLSPVGIYHTASISLRLGHRFGITSDPRRTRQKREIKSVGPIRVRYVKTTDEKRTEGHVYIRSFLTHKEYNDRRKRDLRFGAK
jgi:hypothetical protein